MGINIPQPMNKDDEEKHEDEGQVTPRPEQVHNEQQRTEDGENPMETNGTEHAADDQQQKREAISPENPNIAKKQRVLGASKSCPDS